MTAIDILPPEPASVRGRTIHRASGNVVDASFVTVRRTTVRRSGAAGGGNCRIPPASSSSRPVASRVEVLAGKAEQALMRLSADFFAAIVALVFVLVFGFSGGFSLLSSNAGVVADRPGLDLTHVNLTPQDADGMRVLMINGIVENKGEDRLMLPAIQAHLVTDGTVVAGMLIDPPVAAIESGHSHGFSARLPHPGGKTPELKLSFVPQGASGP